MMKTHSTSYLLVLMQSYSGTKNPEEIDLVNQIAEELKERGYY